MTMFNIIERTAIIIAASAISLYLLTNHMHHNSEATKAPVYATHEIKPKVLYNPTDKVEFIKRRMGPHNILLMRLKQFLGELWLKA